MGLLKLLGKGCSFISETPLPELVGFIGAVSHLIALSEAYRAEAVVEEKLDDGTTIQLASKDPTDVFVHLLPGDRFSVREAVKAYKELDQEGRVICYMEGISAACGVFYGFMNLFRIGRLFKSNCELMNERDSLRTSNHLALEKSKDMFTGFSSVVKYYEGDKSRISSEGDLFNYRNCLTACNDLDYMKGVLA